MTYTVSSGTLNPTQLNPVSKQHCLVPNKALGTAIYYIDFVHLCICVYSARAMVCQAG